MENERTKITPEQIYRSRLSEIHVSYDDGWMRWEKPKEPEPTGIPEMDALAKLLARTPVPSMRCLAQETGMTADTLRSFLQIYTGMTAKVFTGRYRALVGEELLRCTDLEVKEIAWRAGFGRETFSRSFKAHYGQSPSDYRYYKQARNFRELYRWDNGKLKK